MTVFQDVTLGVSSQNGRAVMSVESACAGIQIMLEFRVFPLIVQWKRNAR